MSEVKRENETAPSSNGEKSVSDWAKSWILASFALALFVLVMVIGNAYAKAAASQGYEQHKQQEQEDAAREKAAEKRVEAKRLAEEATRGSQHRHDFLERILSSSDDVAKVTIQDGNGEQCSRRTWAIPAKMVYEVETRHESIDTLYPSVAGLEQGDLPYVPMPYFGIREFEDIKTAIEGYRVANPELKPEREEQCEVSVNPQFEASIPELTIEKPKSGLLSPTLPGS